MIEEENTESSTEIEEDGQLTKLKSRIPYDEDIFGDNDTYVSVLNSLLEDSKNILLETLYPFEDFTEYEVPTQYYGWQLRCCVELYNMADKQGVTNYSENSLSWTKLSDGLSNSLMDKITSNVGVPRKSNRQPLDEGVFNVVYNSNVGD